MLKMAVTTSDSNGLHSLLFPPDEIRDCVTIRVTSDEQEGRGQPYFMLSILRAELANNDIRGFLAMLRRKIDMIEKQFGDKPTVDERA